MDTRARLYRSWSRHVWLHGPLPVLAPRARRFCLHLYHAITVCLCTWSGTFLLDRCTALCSSPVGVVPPASLRLCDLRRIWPSLVGVGQCGRWDVGCPCLTWFGGIVTQRRRECRQAVPRSAPVNTTLPFWTPTIFLATMCGGPIATSPAPWGCRSSRPAVGTSRGLREEASCVRAGLRG